MNKYCDIHELINRTIPRKNYKTPNTAYWTQYAYWEFPSSFETCHCKQNMSGSPYIYLDRSCQGQSLWSYDQMWKEETDKFVNIIEKRHALSVNIPDVLQITDTKWIVKSDNTKYDVCLMEEECDVQCLPVLHSQVGLHLLWLFGIICDVQALLCCSSFYQQIKVCKLRKFYRYLHRSRNISKEQLHGGLHEVENKVAEICASGVQCRQQHWL